MQGPSQWAFVQHVSSKASTICKVTIAGDLAVDLLQAAQVEQADQVLLPEQHRLTLLGIEGCIVNAASALKVPGCIVSALMRPGLALQQVIYVQGVPLPIISAPLQDDPCKLRVASKVILTL